LECFSIYLFISLYSLLYQNEAMSALDQLRERASKREAKLRRGRGKKKTKEKEL
jgi:hypothetical protein